jgi:hypothetical protein
MTTKSASIVLHEQPRLDGAELLGDASSRIYNALLEHATDDEGIALSEALASNDLGRVGAIVTLTLRREIQASLAQ